MRIELECPVHDSFRVQQVAGMFDVPLADRLRETFDVELPPDDDPWQVGLVVGPSGSGKSTVARRVFGDHVYRPRQWPADRAVIDNFADLPLRQVTDLLTAVGFSSPPSWIKPYHVLSGGERFRCDLARALALGCRPSAIGSKPEKATGQPPTANSQQPLVVFDEFTSVVDRNVARVCAAAVARAVRREHVRCRFVAVTCHYDVARWLEPDWTLDMATGRLLRRCLRRPTIRLEIRRAHLAAWRLFARHHYLSGSLAPHSECYLATWEGEPVHFCATLPVIGHPGRRRFTRIVTLPDYQGIGIGMRSVEAVAELHLARGHGVSVTSSHPALLGHCRRSPRWRTTRVQRAGTARAASRRFRNYRPASGRAVVSFAYQGDGSANGSGRSADPAAARFALAGRAARS